MSEGIGARVLRKEDLRFLTGRGEFVADLAAPDALHCAIVRSPHAHARIRSIDVGRAASAAGVVAALVGADMAVDDVGTVVNPMIVEGQLHGAVAQGAGQALGETCVYDARGQLVTASFLDYAVPRADELPGFVSENDESQPCTHNPLGAKGCGEAGTIAAPAAVVNAILDALAPLGVDEIEMPATPHRVWQAIMRARREQAAAG